MGPLNPPRGLIAFLRMHRLPVASTLAAHAGPLLAVALTLLGPAGVAWGQAAPVQPPASLQRGGTFVEPPAVVPPAYLPLPRTPADPVNPAPEEDASPLSLRLAADFPLRGGGAVGTASQGPRAASPTLQADLRYTPWRDAGWFAQAAFLRYLHSDRQQPWNPDFTYSFGYEDWRPDTFSFLYSNYTGTRLRPDRSRGEGRSNFSQGQWSLAYRFDLPEALAPYLLAGDGDAASCRAAASLTPRYRDLASLAMRRNRTSVSAGCRYTRPDGWYAELVLFGYPRHSQQQPWDPDFTYALGYFDWRPGTVSVQYSNYSGNRYPGRTRGPGEGLWRSGSISVSWRVPLE